MRLALRDILRSRSQTVYKSLKPFCPGSCHYSSAASKSTSKWSTPLAKQIAGAINATGPISVAAYMRQCLTSLDTGYYSFQSKDSSTQSPVVIGKEGDFITSPEISQIFGELVGVWIVAEWMTQGRPPGVQIVELGPGKGTLMDDVLRTLKTFKDLASAIESINLIETSPTFREAQKLKLCGDGATMDETETGHVSLSRHIKGVPVRWYSDLRHVPNDASKSPFILAHEFFDALPVHVFQSVPSGPYKESDQKEEKRDRPQTIQTPTGPVELSSRHQSKSQSTTGTNQWRELVVTPVASDASSADLKSTRDNEPHEQPEFQISTAKSSTATSLLLPYSSGRYTDLLKSAGSTIEISPESKTYASTIASRIGGSNSGSRPTTRSPASEATSAVPKSRPSGAALIIDYGPSSTIPTSTLRGIRQHKLVSPFSTPGAVDLSADVDFTALAAAALEASEGVEVHGPVEQGVWLQRMGVGQRAEMLMKQLGSSQGDGQHHAQGGDKISRDEVRVDEVRKAVERLTERGGGGMGRLYKVMAVVPERGGKRPVGFGGGLDQSEVQQ